MVKHLTLLLAAGITAFAQYHPNIPVDNRTIDEIYAAAKLEHLGTGVGPLQVLSGGDAGSQGDSVRTAWKSSFPDIPLNLTVSLSKYINGRIDRAYYEGVHLADVAVLQTLQDFPRWKTANRLVYYKPSHFADLLESEKDFDGAFLPVSIISFGGFVYDTTKLSAAQIPTSFAAFADPIWKSKLILTYPNDDDAVAYLFSLIISRYGVSWLYALQANDVQWVRGTGSPAFELIRQHNDTTSQRCLSFTTSGSSATYLGRASVKAPEHIMSWAQTGAIIAGTPQPETAKLYLAWLSGPARQSRNSTSLTTLQSYNEAKGLSPYTSNTTNIVGFKVFQQDRAKVEWWKNQYEEILGTAQGADPLDVYPNPAYSG